LGSLIITQFHFAALSRADIENHDRVSFYLYADEFQSIITPAFKFMLSEDRKYGLHLTLAHQFTSQLAEEVRDAIFANVATTVAFQLGHKDREL
jgi:type IV secretory pathway TraG/TraD family ATPase VirD4